MRRKAYTKDNAKLVLFFCIRVRSMQQSTCNCYLLLVASEIFMNIQRGANLEKSEQQTPGGWVFSQQQQCAGSKIRWGKLKCCLPLKQAVRPYQSFVLTCEALLSPTILF